VRLLKSSCSPLSSLVFCIYKQRSRLFIWTKHGVSFLFFVLLTCPGSQRYARPALSPQEQASLPSITSRQVKTSSFIDPGYGYVHYVLSIPLYPGPPVFQLEVLPVDFGACLGHDTSIGITHQPLIHTSFVPSESSTFPPWTLDSNSPPWAPLHNPPIADDVLASLSPPLVQTPSVDHLNLPDLTELGSGVTDPNDGAPSFFEPLNDYTVVSWQFNFTPETFEASNFDSRPVSGSSQESLRWNPCSFEDSLAMGDINFNSGSTEPFYTPIPQGFPGLNPRQAITYEDHLPSGSSDFEVAQAPLSVPHPDTNLPQAPPPPLPLPSGLSPGSVRLPANPGIACSHTTCSKTFTRDADRIRHENQVHRNQPGLHVCPIIGCSKSQGKGYSRADKVVEHLWKKHGDLGFVKG
jgi:hypothetical protein